MKNLYIILLILPLIGFGQGWEQTFGGEGISVGHSVQQTTDGGYIITGHTSYFGIFGNFDSFLIKTDENGNEQWYQTYGGTLSDNGRSVQQTTDGGYILTGYTNSFGIGGPGTNGNDIFLIKTDSNGIEQWSITYGGIGDDRGELVLQTSDGGYIIFGRKDNDMFVNKTDENGYPEWSNIFGEPTFQDYGFSGQQTTDGGYIFMGSSYSIDEDNMKLELIKLDENGIEQWSKDYDEPGISMSEGTVKQTNDGGYIIVKGRYLLKVNENGFTEWSISMNISGVFLENKELFDISQTTDGGYIITGNTGDYVEWDVCLVKISENGLLEWSRTLGEQLGEQVGEGFSVQQTTDGGYIITGSTGFKEDNSYDVYLIKTDSEGNVENTSTIELPTPTSKRELIKTTNILGQENTTIKNQPMIEIYDDGSVDKKYIIE